ncbi:MAG: reverse transcriptase, partial [Sulfurovum sp.]|nr:reverse transcriptase [Sulfurovum sp.]
LEKKYSYIRNIDDYECYVETHEKAEEFLIDLASELKKYNLSLNHKKTEILKLPLASKEHWVRRLNTFIFSSDEKLKLGETRAFLDIALDLMKDNKNNSAILNYAIKVLSNKTMTNNAKEYFINTVHHLILLYPYLIPLLDKKVFETFNITASEIEQISQNIFKMGKDKNLYEAMSYALYFSIKYDFKLDDNLFDLIDDNRDAVLMLLAYLHDKKFSNSRRFSSTSPGKNYKELAKALINDIDEYWVFVYEVLTVGVLENEWKKMKQKNVSFIIDGFVK